MRQPINDAELRQELAEFHERSDELMQDINALLRNRQLPTGPVAQCMYAARTLGRVRDAIDCGLQLIPPTD